MSELSPVGPPGPRKAAFAFIFITVLLDMLAIGMIAPVLPRLIVSFMEGNTARGAEMYGVFATAFALMQLIFSPVLGSLSDRFGRRPVILLSNVGLGLDYILMAVAPSIGWLLLGRVIAGITSASYSTAGAYIADVTPPERRAGAFGMLGAAFGVGFVIGPAVGGLLGSYDPRLPFWFAAALSLGNALYGLFVLPESLPKERRAPFDLRRANPFGALALLRSHPELFSLSTVTFLCAIAHEVLPSTFVLYTMYRYGWDERTVGLMLAAVGVSYGIVQGGLVQLAANRFGQRRTLLLGLVCGALGFAFYGTAPTGFLFAMALPISALWGLSGPNAQSLMTHLVAPHEQGRLQGATTSVRGIAGLIAPGMFTFTFARFISPGAPLPLPGAPFLLASLLLVIAVMIVLPTARRANEPAA